MAKKKKKPIKVCFPHLLPGGSVGWTERSALRALKEQLFVHKSDLMSAFQDSDPNNTGREIKREDVFYSLIRVNERLGVREDLFTALGQCHRESAEPGPALEGAAPPARQQHPVGHGGLPAVDTGILHHRAQTRGETLDNERVGGPVHSPHVFCSRSQIAASWRPCTEITATWKPSSAL